MRTRLRPPLPSAPDRVIATSSTSDPTRPSTRARSRPQRISSPSALVRCDRPQPSSAMASSRLVLPAAFGPWTRCAPGPKDASSVAYPRRSRALIELSTCYRHPQRGAVTRAPRSEGKLRDPIGPRIPTTLRRRPDRHDDVDILVVPDRLEHTRREWPVELERELLGTDVGQHVRQVACVERDGGAVALHGRLHLAHVVAHLCVRADRDPAVAVAPDLELDDVGRLVGDERRGADGTKQLLAIQHGAGGMRLWHDL